MFASELVSSSLEYVKAYFNDHHKDSQTYHNLEHSLHVAEEVSILGTEASLPDREVENLVLAALFHDLGHCKGP